MAGIFDIDDKKVISSTNLLENGWIYEGSYYNHDYNWSKIIKLDLGDGYYCYCEFLLNSHTNKIHSNETNKTCTISNIAAINRFIDKQLNRRLEKYKSYHEYI